MNDIDTGFVVMAWRELLARHAEVSCALERELSDRHGLGVSEFEVLERLVEAGQSSSCAGPEAAKFRVQELAGQVHLSQSALSRLIARLEREGLVARALCEADRRGVFVHVTEEGRRRHAEATPTHRAILSAHLFPHLVNAGYAPAAPDEAPRPV
ncbi:DNA-binding transcriptional regulator, MarR family [Microbispora rosea]|uniref:DNA-binding transcriptional regulator, MarR family n=1 Tax=Microbispora rosea TaxID=58117 RepID=A0A1N6SZV4_9ACTN|nr:MarR family transcriptional regulator [Microbispora rosea]GIH45252.1 MarR family transcriptional regulator [Microbispora rosea subsp. rosea]SIQ46633.1 DNA-binding transcriptional regulator, MarR family [Microbispora rosea]